MPAAGRRVSLRPGSSIPAGLLPLSNEPIVHDSEPGAFLFGSWKNVLVAVWESRATAPAVERMATVVSALARAHPEGRSNVHIVADGAGLPEPQVRAQFVELMKQGADELACVAIVVGGTGFWASALRSFVTGLRWLAPRSFDLRLHGAIEEVPAWLPKEHLHRTGVELDPRRFEKVLKGWATASRK